MALLIGVGLLVAALVFQSSVFAHLRLLHGSPDLVLLTLLAWLLHPRLPWPWAWPLLAGALVGWVSGLPWYLPVLGYALAGGIALALRGRLWRVSLLAYLFLVVFASLLTLGLTWAGLYTLGTPIPWGTAFTQVILPATLLNFLLALPVHGVVTEFAAWALPEAEEAV